MPAAFDFDFDLIVFMRGPIGFLSKRETTSHEACRLESGLATAHGVAKRKCAVASSLTVSLMRTASTGMTGENSSVTNKRLPLSG